MPLSFRSRAAFTLTEVSISMAVAATLGVAIMAFFISSLRMAYNSQQQIKLLGTMRTVSSELIYNASRAHEYVLFESASDRTRKEMTDEDGNDIQPTGNFAIFINYELPKPASQGKYRIAKLVGYYPRSTSDGGQELIKLTIDLSAAPSTDTVEDILTDNWDTATRKVVGARIVPLALAEDATAPQLFYARSLENIAMCGQLLDSNAGKLTKDRNTLTRTFYFTLTVRS